MARENFIPRPHQKLSDLELTLIMYLDRFKARFQELGRVKKRYAKRVLSCTEKQVRSLEKQCGLSLPAAYKEFLLWGGIQAGGFLVGSDFFYDPQMYQLREGLEALLKEDEFPEPLPEDAFVFGGHQGYIFWFFKTSDGDDPPVYGYKEESAPILFEAVPFRKIAPSYSQFLLEALEEEAS